MQKIALWTKTDLWIEKLIEGTRERNTLLRFRTDQKWSKDELNRDFITKGFRTFLSSLADI